MARPQTDPHYAEFCLHLGRILRYYRMKQQISTKIIAHCCGVRPSSIASIECGEPPSFSTLHKICRVLKLKVSDVVFAAENKQFTYNLHGRMRRNAG